MAAAAATLGWLGLLWYRGQWGTQDARMRQVLVLLVSLASIRGIYALLHWSADWPAVHAAPRGYPAAGAVDIPGTDRAAAVRRPAGRDGPPEVGRLLDALNVEAPR